MNEKEQFLPTFVRTRALDLKLYLLSGHKIEDVEFNHLQLEEVMEEKHSGGNLGLGEDYIEANE